MHIEISFYLSLDFGHQFDQALGSPRIPQLPKLSAIAMPNTIANPHSLPACGRPSNVDYLRAAFLNAPLLSTINVYGGRTGPTQLYSTA
jgi:hypothetical protein